MQSPTNKFSQSFSSLFPNINKNKCQVPTPNKNFELNNQGCKCQLCQKIILQDNMKIMTENINDSQSEQYVKDNLKEHYIELIEEISTKWKYKRTVRFFLPEICLYQNNNPAALIEKKKQSNPLTINKSKSRLHFFQIQSFFLHGFVAQSPTKKARLSKKQAFHKAYVNECIVFAKYVNNCYRMMTYNEIQSIFRSKNKSMKDGLMYLQTVIGGDSFKSVTVIVKLDDIQKNEDIKILWERAKLQVKIITGQIKLTDIEFYEESQQIQFQEQLKYFDINRFLLYLSYKMILISSKFNPEIIKNSVFKYSVVNKKVFLFDLRVIQFGSCLKYWSSNVLQALQIKLKKTMSLMQLDNPEKQDKFKIFQSQLSKNSRQLSNWLKKSTQEEWEQMTIIRKRLEKLEEQKKSLQKSQNQQLMRKNFKVRSIQHNKIKQNAQKKVDISLNM